VRFEVSKVLDAIEKRLSTDPALARGVVDLAEIVRYQDLDGGRPSTLLRLGQVVDALGRFLAEENVPVFAVVDRALLSDVDLSSNERMVIRRWADDGLVEVLPDSGDRVLEVAELTGLPVISRETFADSGRAWLKQPGRLLVPATGPGTPRLRALVTGTPDTSVPEGSGKEVLNRLWRCPEAGCGAFGSGRVGRPGGQPPPRMRNGVPICPRHDVQLLPVGPRPAAEVLVVRIDGSIRQRFVVSADQSVTVGRAPDGIDQGPGVLMLGPWLSEEARRWISRSHVVLEMLATDLVARDVSTNGTVVRVGGSTDEADRLLLSKDQVRKIAVEDVLELYPGVQVARAGRLDSKRPVEPKSVMAEAPTMMIQLPQG